MDNVILTVAIIGGGPTREQNPHIPITPEEIADSAIESFKAGASIAHIHVRDPKTETPSNDVALFSEVVERVRSKCDMILNLSAGYGGGMIISEEGEIMHALQSADKRVEHVTTLKPEICSLDIGTVNFGPAIFANAQGVVDKMAAIIKDCGVKPEIELFDIGHIEIAKRLIKLGLVEGTPHFQLCMGTAAGLAATPKLQSITDSSPESLFGTFLSIHFVLLY